MRKVAENILAIISRVIFIGFSIQIVLGFVWMWGAFTGVQQFGESYFYVEVSKTLLCDEYLGIAYPALLAFVRRLSRLFSFPDYVPVYLIQIIFATYAAHRFLQSMRRTGRFFDLWSSLVILTIPMAMQCHMAILPQSLTGSCILMELSYVMEACKKNKISLGLFWKPFLCWLLAALLMPEYAYLGAIGMLFLVSDTVIKLWKEKKKLFFWPVVCGCILAGVIAGANQLCRTEGAYGRMHRSIPSAFLCRTAGTCLAETYNYWPDDLKACMDDQTITETLMHADNLVKVFGPAVEQSVGIERAEQIYLEVSKAAWQVYSKKILREILLDAASYTVAPVALQFQLGGRAYDSYSINNYDVMRMEQPKWTAYYMNYGSWCFGVMLLLAAFIQILWWIYRIYRKRIMQKENIMGIICCIFLSVSIIAWYTMQGAAMMDYKNSILVTVFWTAFMISVTEKGKMYAYLEEEEIK